MTLQKWKERKGNIMKATKEKHEKAKKKKHTKDCKNIPKTHTHTERNTNLKAVCYTPLKNISQIGSFPQGWNKIYLKPPPRLILFSKSSNTSPTLRAPRKSVSCFCGWLSLPFFFVGFFGVQDFSNGGLRSTPQIKIIGKQEVQWGLLISFTQMIGLVERSKNYQKKRCGYCDQTTLSRCTFRKSMNMHKCTESLTWNLKKHSTNTFPISLHLLFQQLLYLSSSSGATFLGVFQLSFLRPT